eukprot:Nitzschia sp. Nitz4//scaffold30_size153850//108286//109989//NITZ4_002788-RA/size153850-processed-gene-0.48-mRNA-1//-1//CDS//3329547294//7560//frame0
MAQGSSSTCASATQYQCPHLSDICNETVYVSDCLDCDGFLSTDSITDVCFDRKLLNGKDNPDSSYLWRDILGLLVWFVAAGVATACGVGGGGIYVPLGILLLNFAPKPSSGLSQASIFGASLGGLLLNSRNKHPFTTQIDISPVTGHLHSSASIPTKDEHPPSTDTERFYDRPLIDYDMALFLAPMEMAGAVLGVLIQKILPNWLYLTLAAIILAFTAHKTYLKFFDTRQKEMAEREGVSQTVTPPAPDPKVYDEDEENYGSTDDNGIAMSASPAKEEAPVMAASAPTEDSASIDSKMERLTYWLERDSRQFPMDKLFGLLVLWIGLVLLTFLKGGKGVDSVIGIDCTSPWYGVLIAIQFAWTLGISALFGYRLMRQTQEKKACDYPWHPQDVQWDFEKVRFYAFFTFIAGIVAGLIGIGGGMVLGPLMLVMGIHPRVSSATTATMIVLTSSSVAVLFVTAGLVPWEYALTFFCVCFFGAYIGKTKIDGYVKRTGRASILIFLLATIIALATLGCVVIVLTRLAAADWCFAGFNKFCHVSDDADEDSCPVHRLLFGASTPDTPFSAY